mgnify:CR=1 FL=1
MLILKNHPFSQIQTGKLEWNDIKVLGNHNQNYFPDAIHLDMRILLFFLE